MNQDIRTKRRLEITHLIREENRMNQLRMQSRENILYGKSYADIDTISESLPTAHTANNSSFGLRFLLALLIFAFYFICKTKEISVAGITSGQIEMLVSLDFIDQFPYTLHDS
jgi:hypothetical protein